MFADNHDKHAIRSIPPGRLIVLIAFACIAGGVAGWFFGALAGAGYGLHNDGYRLVSLGSIMTAGQQLGIGSGLIAAVMWCMIVIPRSVGSFERLGGLGASAGSLVGTFSTILLHIGLIRSTTEITSAGTGLSLGGIGLMCGIVAGAIAGAVCGCLCRWAVRPACSSGNDNDQESSE